RISNASDPARHPSGQVNHSRVYQGRAVHARAAATTRGRSVDGALGGGNARRWRSTKRSSSKAFTLLCPHQLTQRLAATMNVGLDFPERNAQSRGDVLIAEIFEVKQDQRHALVIGELTNRALELLMPLRMLEILGNGRRDRHDRRLIELLRGAVGIQ